MRPAVSVEGVALATTLGVHRALVAGYLGPGEEAASADEGLSEGAVEAELGHEASLVVVEACVVEVAPDVNGVCVVT